MIKVIRNEKSLLIPFEEIKKGDRVFVKGKSVMAAYDSHYSGDADYDGYLFYDTRGNSVFPEDCEPVNELDLKPLVLYGLEAGIVNIIDSPHEDGAVCEIGDYWFYFGGQTAEEMTAEEYVRNVPQDDIVREIVDALKEFSVENETEYVYYIAYLREAVLEKLNQLTSKKTAVSEIFINVSGGLVTDVYSSISAKVTVIDHDVQDEDEEEKADNALNECIRRVNNGELSVIY